MPNDSPPEVTQLLHAWHDGDAAALAQLTPLVYGELQRLAHGYLRGERAGHTLQTTALINEAYLRLFDWQHVEWQDRAHFIAIAAQMMRRVLVDFARARHYAKRGSQAQQLEFDETLIAAQQRDAELIALDDALQLLGEVDPRKCRIVELRYFGGLSVDETAEALQLSRRTVLREWKLARAWLYRELRSPDLGGADET
ncbi:MAG: sigma-70 family RNA polymerase sigma factor [Acidobacteria bacterium]|nr:sigma-70 family RNA polymerase sigma factor [Acidobacteriota bacterium]MBI3425979.1 sigma-70 family RNA polymerase sigma factor [Acidobacteriota bacterium]